LPAQDQNENFQGRCITEHVFRKRMSGAMSTWILIPGAGVWLALLLLILNRYLRKAPSLGFSRATVSKPTANLKTARTSSSSSEPLRLDAQPLIDQTPAAAPKRWWTKDSRISKTAEELELAITEAVKAAPGCEAFVGVIIQRITPKARLDVNWELRGTRFGQADRKIAREALTPIVEQMQREFRLPDGPT